MWRSTKAAVPAETAGAGRFTSDSAAPVGARSSNGFFFEAGAPSFDSLGWLVKFLVRLPRWPSGGALYSRLSFTDGFQSKCPYGVFERFEISLNTSQNFSPAGVMSPLRARMMPIPCVSVESENDR